MYRETVISFWFRTTSFHLLVLILCCITTRLVTDVLKIFIEPQNHVDWKRPLSASSSMLMLSLGCTRPQYCSHPL